MFLDWLTMKSNGLQAMISFLCPQLWSILTPSAIKLRIFRQSVYSLTLLLYGPFLLSM